MRLPAPAWTLVLQLCPHAGAHDGVGGLRGKQGVGDKASLAAGRAGAAQPAVKALGSIQGHFPGDNSSVPHALLLSSYRPEQDRVSPPDTHRATHVLRRCPPLSSGAAAREPGTQIFVRDEAVASDSLAPSLSPRV